MKLGLPSRGAARRGAALVLLVLATAAPAPRAATPGPFTRAAEKSGEASDTSPRSSAHGFVNDRADDPFGLSLWVDTEATRYRLDPALLPLRVGLRRAGKGEDLLVRADRFVLRWEGAASPVRGLSNDALHATKNGTRALWHDTLPARTVGVVEPPFDAGDGRFVRTAFYSDASLGVSLNESCQLWPDTWLADWLFVRLPDGLDPAGRRLELAFVDADGRDLVVTSFRLPAEKPPRGRPGAGPAAR